ncbi:hypothetical protein [Williamsia sterculiae]|uniref:MmpS family membrane protein n=1 Tax=Williamsia sterculiae TaxID=1344003 RepID=A0A1N7CDN0_9NOCA|nr:hypothetical protein [Williamsia sterculiae]SIR61692.1 hypothetical protein SAMN05445060_0059 [Williamsia sterculiae]
MTRGDDEDPDEQYWARPPGGGQGRPPSGPDGTRQFERPDQHGDEQYGDQPYPGARYQGDRPRYQGPGYRNPHYEDPRGGYDDTRAYSQADYSDPYGRGPEPQYGGYDNATYGTQGYADQGYGEQGGEPPKKGGGSKGLWIALAVVATIVVIALAVGFLAFGGHDNARTATASTAPTMTATQTDTPTETETPTTDETTQEPSTEAPTTAGGQTSTVEYRLSGDASVVALTYSVRDTTRVEALVALPFSRTVQVVGDPVMRGIVVRGSMTCEITRDGLPIARTTHAVGPFQC